MQVYRIVTYRSLAKIVRIVSAPGLAAWYFMPKDPSDWHESLLARLVKRLSVEPSTDLNPRCLSEQTLFGVLDDIKEGDRLRDSKSKSRIVVWLQEIGLMTVIPVDYTRGKSRACTRFYSFDIAKSPSSRVDPIELLQAYSADGVICYFTAIAFYSLSTQLPIHHHIAIPFESHTRSTAVRTTTKRRPAVARNPLGTHLFDYDGLPFYETSREKRLLPGVQSRYIGPAAVIRITTLEQTLLDTLHRPLHCGGPAVVFEAWNQGLPRVNEDRLADYLASMDHRATVQRLGYMLDDLDYKPRSKLQDVLDRCRSRLDPADSSVYRQLFPGMEYRNLSRSWLVYGP